MKVLIKALIFTSMLLFNNFLYAETNIVYLDMNIIFNETKVGKLIFTELEKIQKNNISNFKKSEESLKINEQEIFLQKNILSVEEYEKKILSFKEKVDKYKSNRNKSINELKNKRVKSINELSRSVNEILAEYSKEKKISFIIPKKNIIMGKSELDITSDILMLVDKKIKKININ
jgi:Skp family chaperone for outer membrane proteins